LGPWGDDFGLGRRGFDGWFGFLAKGGRSQSDGQECSSIHIANLARKENGRQRAINPLQTPCPLKADIERIDASGS
jgi:hypothetical protein